MNLLSLAMVELRLRVPVSRAQSAAPPPPPEVRFWVDLEAEGALGAEIEVALQLEQPWVFRGSFELERSARQDFFYRLGMRAVPGSLWTLRIREGVGEGGRDLMSDGDTLDTPKSWLVGTCPLGQAAAPGASGTLVQLEDYRLRRASRVHRSR